MIKKHHKAQPPHEVSTKFHCSHQMILQSPSTSKNPLKSPQKESNYLSTTNFSGGLVKPPFFLDFSRFSLCRTACQKHPYWWILVKSPPGIRYSRNYINGMELLTARSQRYIILCITYMMNTFMLRKFAPATM